MTDLIQETPKIPKLESIRSRISGGMTLVLVFLAAGSFTWAYLKDTSVQIAAAAEAVAPLPPLAPLHDPDAFSGITLFAKSAIVVDITDGRTLFARSPDSQWPLASLTKVALALVVSEALDPHTIVSIPYDTGYNSHAEGGLGAGQRWRIEDVIDFTLAVSSNTGADILAEIAAPSIQEKYPHAPTSDVSVWRMNKLARSLDLERTYFLNNNGLDVSDTQAGAYGSARDIATLFAYAASTTPETFAATRVRQFTLQSVDGVTTKAVNTDEALPDLPDIVLGKTGFTQLAGGNLAVVFRHDGHLISVVVLGSTYDGRFDDMKKLVAATQKALGSE